MITKAISRRTVLGAGICTLTATAVIPPRVSAHTEAGLSSKNSDTARKYYAAWESKEWRLFDILLTDDFTFTSPNNDDHISKRTFKTSCWQSQVDFIERFDLKRVVGNGNDAFVLYVCRTKNGKSFCNVEYLRLRGDQVEAVEVYFGAQSSFASAAATG